MQPKTGNTEWIVYSKLATTISFLDTRIYFMQCFKILYLNEFVLDQCRISGSLYYFTLYKEGVSKLINK